MVTLGFCRVYTCAITYKNKNVFKSTYTNTCTSSGPVWQVLYYNAPWAQLGTGEVEGWATVKFMTVLTSMAWLKYLCRLLAFRPPDPFLRLSLWKMWNGLLLWSRADLPRTSSQLHSLRGNFDFKFYLKLTISPCQTVMYSIRVCQWIKKDKLHKLEVSFEEVTNILTYNG